MANSSMIFETVFTEGVAHLSYLIGDSKTGKAAVIDPRRDVDVYLDLARKRKISITHIIETHIHADFVSGTRELIARVGSAKAFLSTEGKARYGFPHERLRDRDTINLGRVILTARHTPGHTPEHMSFLAAEENRPKQPFAVFSGDCLFSDSVGRPDLLGEDETETLARQLYKSLHDVFLKLPDDVRVHAAHGAGSPCGANIGDRLVSTIGYERVNNRALRFRDRKKFLNFVLSTSPPEPIYYPRMKKINAKGPPVLGSLPPCPSLPPKEFQAAFAKGGQLLDNRHMLAFGGGHIAGALNLGPKPELSIWAGWMLSPTKPIFLVLGDDEDLPRVQSELIRVGFTNFGGYLLGGMEAWSNAALPFERLTQITVHQVKDRSDQVQVIDVRSPKEWEDGHVPGAQYMFLPELEKKSAELDRKKPVAVYCDSGYRASIGASLLKKRRFQDVRNVAGSWKAWKAAGYKVETAEDKDDDDTDR